MVVHILGKGFKGKTLIDIGLSSKFYGVGLQTAQRLCSKLGFYPSMRMHQLNEQQVMAITKELSDLTIEGKLRSVVRENIQLKRTIGSYAGLRHAMGLPVRGQRTKTNAKTAKKLNKLNRWG
ncbi:Putative mitochondrial ribosomal protein of the small subunit [Komagataella phaffii CBS 7435]|uniref:Small ribosomal subunit protein uS13m n=2 Tax=Komagataella phaffii TaxID=460519 RepID=C4R4T3_KOMPG|nr:putative mitochondrial 37S ribosomal protein SWS2 [Komagataella phaffii GS115]KAI0463765.1 37S ribosomal protein subunit sws2, mitochondrial [Komagataella kurtzmanii]CAH2449669.1 Putative mitochondrial ribosomal protein of the small subunit [Komagataella phaffii CBS 7435]CAY70569.1 Putative mitochondrial ribosomal protein of the small subunit [Komagataella phaffii GS115]CCA39642.2 Putative mitochondrial ribosomal protein of the small subunit [Komagataella phaffii CBS 7435]